MKKTILILFVTTLITSLPLASFASDEIQPYSTYKSVEAQYPEFGNKPWEEDSDALHEKEKAAVKEDCKKKEESIREKERLLKIAQEKKKADELAEKSLVDMEVPTIDDYKTWMSYTSVKAKSTPQYRLLNSSIAYTDEENFRRIGDYYCVALGSFYSREIGTRFKVTFADGQSIKVILGDQKQDRHTDSKHQYSSSGNIIEFIMGSRDNLNQTTINNKFPGGVTKIQMYTNEENTEW